jgi:serine O-acetyltransferase
VNDVVPLPRVEDCDPVVAGLLDLLLPPPAGGHRRDSEALAELAVLITRCGGERAPAIVDTLGAELPRLRRDVELDVRAAFEGDPACPNETEAAVCYPGIHALAIHRLAHELYRRDVPLVPRLLAACSHRRTGIDIHPGARIEHSVFIDHGTGVVIGATARIGAHCRLYQGVTLGTMSVGRGMDADEKRHPTLEDHVVVYAGATILGGDTVIGSGCVVGGGVFLTESVAPGHIVTRSQPVIRLRENPVRPPVSFAI